MSGQIPPRLEASSLFVDQSRRDQIRCETYNTILAQVHNKIRATNRIPGNGQQLLYLVPEFIPGVPRFNMKECIIYLAYNLRASDFLVKYTHPNALYISWQEQGRNYVLNESPYTRTLIQITEEVIKKQQSTEIVPIDPKQKKSNMRKTSEYKSGSYVPSPQQDDHDTKNVHFI
jgi:hypothetical protein